MSVDWPISEHDFAAYYRFAPAALALRECVRLKAVRGIELPEPILDIGCGDGLFARMAFPDRQSWGIDINPAEVKRAQATRTYSTLICGSVCDVDLPRGFFGSAIANCSLEHVPDIHKALSNVRPSLKDGAPFVLIVPTPEWTAQLATVELLRRAGLGDLARAYSEGIDRVFRHIHMLDEDGWADILRPAGFEIVESRPIVDRRTSWAFDVLLYPSVIGWLVKKATGRWVISPLLRDASERVVWNLLNTMSSRVEAGPGQGEHLLICRAIPSGGTSRR